MRSNRTVPRFSRRYTGAQTVPLDDLACGRPLYVLCMDRPEPLPRRRKIGEVSQYCKVEVNFLDHGMKLAANMMLTVSEKTPSAVTHRKVSFFRTLIMEMQLFQIKPSKMRSIINVIVICDVDLLISSNDHYRLLADCV